MPISKITRKNRVLSFLLMIAGFSILPVTARAREQILYRYDALGRLEKSYRETEPAQGILSSTQYDKAGNRIAYDTGNVVQIIGADQSILSPDGRFKLAMQPGGNLVLYFGGPGSVGRAGHPWNDHLGGVSD
jgi:hypothetical protein